MHDDYKKADFAPQFRYEPPQVIEKTSKRYKRIILAGYTIMLLGLVLCIVMMANETTTMTKTGIVLLLVLGLAVTAYGKGMAWWHHG
jgi:hypothetical protein